MEVRAVKCTIREQLTWTKHQITTLKTQLNVAQLALEKLTDESSGTKAALQAQVVSIVKDHNVERARIERLERGKVSEAEKRQQLLAKRREACELVT